MNKEMRTIHIPLELHTKLKIKSAIMYVFINIFTIIFMKMQKEKTFVMKGILTNN